VFSLLGATAKPSGSIRIRSAPTVASQFSRGSPMPNTTMFQGSGPVGASATMVATWPRISQTRRLRR